MSGLKHMYARTTWLCTSCGEPWPCQVKRIMYFAEFAGRRTELRMLIGAHFEDARSDFAADPVNNRSEYEQLYARFFGWLGRANQTLDSYP